MSDTTPSELDGTDPSKIVGRGQRTGVIKIIERSHFRTESEPPRPKLSAIRNHTRTSSNTGTQSSSSQSHNRNSPTLRHVSTSVTSRGENGETKTFSVPSPMSETGGSSPTPLAVHLRHENGQADLTREFVVDCAAEFVNDREINIRSANKLSIKLEWVESPSTVLIVKKPGDEEISFKMHVLAKWLTEERGLQVVVEPIVHREEAPELMTFTPGSDLTDVIDILICLGGDGTILHANTLFKFSFPPLLSFNLGSLGFLTPFDFSCHRALIDDMLAGRCFLTLRERLVGVVRRGNTIVKSRTPVINEVVIDRGNSPFMTQLDILINHEHVSTIAADGVIIASSTGSTAYSLAAGGSIMHPHVQAMIVTFICPHTLSARPLVLPDSALVTIRVPDTARTTVWAAFDGRDRTELARGDEIDIRLSRLPLPCVSRRDSIVDWFDSINSTLQWNARKPQKAFFHEQADKSHL